MNTLLQQINEQGWVQWISFITGVAYIYYATNNNPWCWPWGIVSSGLWTYASWFQLHLLSDAFLQATYVILGFLGWYQWLSSRKNKGISKTESVLPVTRYPVNQLIIWLVITALLSGILGYVMHFTTAAFPYLDAYLTVFSLLATWMLVNRKIETWILWIIIDFISIPVFIWRGGHLFALLFLIYGILAFKGWRSWQPLLKRN